MHFSVTPRVSIGVPVYNGGASLREALESLRTQSFNDIEILISDNCSSDATEAICLEYANRDPRFRYVRQPENIGAAANFRYVLTHSLAEFFLWNAADDTRSPNFIEINLLFLEHHPEYVASTSPTKYVGGEFDPIRMGDASLEATCEKNFIAFFNTWHANGRFYSLFRRAALTRCDSLDHLFFASDWAFILECCLQGKFRRVDEGWTLIGRGGVSQSSRRFSASRNHWYEYIMPLLELSKVAWILASTFSVFSKARLILILFRLNVMATWAQMRLAFRSMLGRWR